MSSGSLTFADLARTVPRYWHMLRRVPLAQLRARLRSLRRRRHPPSASMPDTAVQPLPAPADAAPSCPLPGRRDRARVSGGKLLLRLPWGEFTFPFPPDWRAPRQPDPLTRSLFARLHYMDYLESLDDGDVVALVSDWIRNNPPDDRDAWRISWRPYNLSVRISAWACELARRHHRLPADAVADMSASLALQTRFLAHNLELDLRGNHLIRNLRALLRSARMFAGPEARQWQATAEQLLGNELAEQILADGCHYERSPSYHRMVLADLLDCRSCVRDARLRGQLDRAIADMLRVTGLLTHPDGRIAHFNDGGLSVGPGYDELCTAAGATPVLDAGGFALREAGYFGFRAPGELLVVDCGPIGPEALPGHGHCDMLSFEWSTGGHGIVVDPGVFQYKGEGRRRAARSTASHNTVSVANAEQSDIFGEFRCGRRARPELRLWEAGSDHCVFLGSHDGFLGLPGQPRHVRRIEATRGFLKIVDTLEASRPVAARGSFLLHPECRIERRDEHRAILRHGPVTVEFASSRPFTVEDAEWWPDLYVAVPTVRLVVEFDDSAVSVWQRL